MVPQAGLTADRPTKKLERELDRGEYVVEEVLEEQKIDGELQYLLTNATSISPQFRLFFCCG
jgi:hypothetical protein